MAKLQGLDRGLNALKVIAASPQGISVAQLAVEVDIDRAVAYRVVATLEEQGFVVREGKLLRLGAAVVSLSQGFHSHLLLIAQPVLQDLANVASVPAFLTIQQGDDFCVPVLEAQPATQDSVLSVSYRIGVQHSINRGANGIAILAALPARANQSDEVEKARQQGFSVTSGHLQPGTTGVASGFLVPGKIGASVGLVAVDAARAERFSQQVKDSANRLSELARL